MESLSNSFVGTTIKRLCLAFGKPYGVAMEAQAEEWLAAFRRTNLSRDAVEAAVNEAIDTGKRFPSVGELIERARAHRAPAPRQEEGDACPSCRMLPFYAGYEFTPIAPRGREGYSRPGGVLPKMRCGCPKADPAWWTPDALAWEETDAGMAGTRKPRDYATNPRYRGLTARA